MRVDIKGQVVLVCGASRGLGECAARAFAKEGARVAVVARTKSAIDGLAQEIRDGGGEALSIEADLTVESGAVRVAETVRREWGLPDVVITCVGESLLRDQLRDNTAEDWFRVFQANPTPQFYVMREFLASMVERGSGHIINVASMVAVHGVAKAAAYGAAKAAAVHFSQTYGASVGKNGVNVVTLAPGPMDTPMRWEATPHFDPKRASDPNDIADLFVWMVSHPNLAFDTPLVPRALMY